VNQIDIAVLSNASPLGRRHWTRLHLFILALMASSHGIVLFGAAPAFPEATRLAEEYLARREITPFVRPASFDDAYAFQKSFVKKLEPELGKLVGYKVGLVSREAQERYKINSPVRGVLLEQMLLPNGSGVTPGFALRPIFEADLIVVVKDKEINQAASLFDVADHLKEVVAFIELPDNYLPTNKPIDGVTLMAGNVGARLGVMGQRLPFESNRRFIESLANMVVTITDQTGAELGRGQGKAILDQPLNSVLWLIEQMDRAGEKLKPGDLISLGTIKTIPYPAGKTVTVRYLGLPRSVLEVSATLP
jgi:2-keto-4-pentenoate hydratase